jgi:hypothetical protein
MMPSRSRSITALAAALLFSALAPRASSGRAASQPPGPQRPGGPGRGGPGASPPEAKLVERFDIDGNKRLDIEERRAARAYITSARTAAGRLGRMGGPGLTDGGGAAAPVGTGRRIAPGDVPSPAGTPIYDLSTLRTFFLDFETADWEQELVAFYNTDVDVPATLTVDGQVYRDVGVHFRGQSSFFTVPEGRKRSLNLSLDLVRADQHLGGHRTFNLLNSHMDPTYLRTVLYLQAAREYIPAPLANYVRVAINGESWGVYVSAEQFNKDFVTRWFGTAAGARWKVPGSPGGRGGLEYLGEDPAPYRRLYEIKSKDEPAAWSALIALCRVLNETPADRLESALSPMLDVNGVLKFLALDATLANGDGYWTRASDYSLYLDTSGRFHVIPHDANETFGPGGGREMGPGGPGRGLAPRAEGFGGSGGGLRPPSPGAPPGSLDLREGRGGGRGGPGGGAELDPLVGLDDPTKPLRSKLLAVPSLRARYLADVRAIATRWLDWGTIEPLVRQYQSLIVAEVEADVRRLDTFDAFRTGVDRLRSFVERRRLFLLDQTSAGAGDPANITENVR